jgi:hypothetical protein
MGHSVERMSRVLPSLPAAAALTGVCALLAWDIRPQFFPANAHTLLGALPLAMIAVAWLAHHAAQRASFRDWLKAVLLSAAFLFWAANQCLPNARAAALCNDIAIALFVFDLVLVVAARPAQKAEDETARAAVMMGGIDCCGGLNCEMCRADGAGPAGSRSHPLGLRRTQCSCSPPA